MSRSIPFGRMPGSSPKREGKRKGGKVIIGEEKGRKIERKEGKEEKGKQRKYKEKGYQMVSASLLFFILAKVAWQSLRDCRACSLKTNWMSRPGLKASL